MKVVTRLVLAFSFMFTSLANAEVILSIDPATQSDTPGSTVSMMIRIDGLGDGVPQSLSSFDIDVEFDTSVLSFAGYNLFDDLGDISNVEADDFSFGEYAAGVVNVSELSYLSTFDLWDFQPGGFALAELLFTINPNATKTTTDVSFTYASLLDGEGFLLNNFGGVRNASVSVPAPATVLMMGIALVALSFRKKSNKSGI